MTSEEKQKAIDALKISAPIMAVTQEKFTDYIQTLNKIMDWLEQEPKTGHWISRPHIYGVAFCSKCGFELKINNTNYCPNCGAKMVEPQETETWNGYHGQITAPKGAFERIFNDADDDNDI